MKHIHRLMMTSAAYRMDSTASADNFAKDEDNVYLWRMNSRRMEAEVVRDSVLAVAGQLDRTMSGPELEQNQGLTGKRRSIYYRYAPEKMMEFLTLFDSPNVSECYQRTESVVPHQALAMANSSLVLANARLLARGLNDKLGKNVSATDFVRAGFQHVLTRPPTLEEQQACERFLESQTKLLADPKALTGFSGGAAVAVPPSANPALRAREDLIHVLLNHSDFVTIR